jgi:hypothetical protein
METKGEIMHEIVEMGNGSYLIIADGEDIKVSDIEFTDAGLAFVIELADDSKLTDDEANTIVKDNLSKIVADHIKSINELVLDDE